MPISSVTGHNIVSPDAWFAARKDLLAREKELTRHRDAVEEARRALPWLKIEKNYEFEGPEGRETLSDLFQGRSQLIVQHFMFSPDWKEGCIGCSFKSDHVDGALPHLEHHDVSFVSVSRAPLAAIKAFKQRMGWRFKWVSSYTSDFNFDFNVSFTQKAAESGTVFYNYETRPFESEELSGNSVFYKDEAGVVYHTYSTTAGATRCWIPLICTWTSRRKGATRPVRDSISWIGYSITTNTI